MPIGKQDVFVSATVTVIAIPCFVIITDFYFNLFLFFFMLITVMGSFALIIIIIVITLICCHLTNKVQYITIFDAILCINFCVSNVLSTFTFVVDTAVQ